MKSSEETEEESEPLLEHYKKTNDVLIHKGYGTRHTFSILAFFGTFNVFALRFNMSVAIVAMTNVTNKQSNASQSQECQGPNLNATTHISRSREFDWDEAEQGLILSSFFYGYIVTQIPAGRLAEIIGGKKLFGFAILFTAILTLLTPLLANVGAWALILLRAVEGLAQGATFPALFAMQGKWTPANERTVLPAFVSAGASLGNVICLPLCGYLSSVNIFGGWPSNFYVFGITACIWWIFWQLLIHETPADHPRISPEERSYIETTAGSRETHSKELITTALLKVLIKDRRNQRIDALWAQHYNGAQALNWQYHLKHQSPWKSILTSSPVWALNIYSLTLAWGYYILMTSIPTYMKRIQKFDIAEDGLLMALPNILNVILSIFGGSFADFLLKRKLLSVIVVRKLFAAIGMVSSALCLSAISFAGCNHVIIVSLLTISNGMNGISGNGITANILDIGHNFAGTLMGIINFSANISGIVAPYLVGLITNHNETMQQWKIVFFISVGMNLIGILVYLLFAKGISQRWNEQSVNETVVIQYTDRQNVKLVSSQTES